MRVLGISTSTPRGSVAVVDDAGGCARVAYEGESHHAERLFDAIDELLAGASIVKDSIEVIACDVGPGSFTGVRAGLAAAKGAALALGLPLVGVGALAAMAAAAWSDPRTGTATRVACLVDAKRGETFFAVYDRALTAVTAPGHVSSDRAIGTLGGAAPQEGLLFAGAQALALGLDRRRILDGVGCDLPDAVWIARRGRLELERGAVPGLDAVEAVYLRAPDAVPMAGRR